MSTSVWLFKPRSHGREKEGHCGCVELECAELAKSNRECNHEYETSESLCAWSVTQPGILLPSASFIDG